MLKLLPARQSAPGSHKPERFAFLSLLLSLVALVTAGCGTTTDTGAQPSLSPTTLSAVTVSTPVSSKAMPLATATAQGTQSALSTSAWAQSSVTVGGTTFTYRYPPAWSHDLVYCPKGGQNLGAHLPVGCATTDFLSGKKLQDVVPSIKVSTAKAMTSDGRRVLAQAAVPQDTEKAARTYTAILYSSDGTTPVFGFATYIGPGTSAAEQSTLLALLDGVASTLGVAR